MSGVWWFTVVNTADLSLVSTDVPESLSAPLSVQSVDSTETEHLVAVKCTGEKTFSLNVTHYKAVDKTFQLLENLTSRRRFCSLLESKVKEIMPPTVVLSDAESDGDVEPRGTSRSFKEEVEIMRRLHPDRLKPGNEFLDSSNRKWRQDCTDLFKCTDRANFGGSYREQIYCSCLPDCCFQQLLGVFQSFESGILESAKKIKTIKPGLFSSLVGCKEEIRVHSLLSRLSTSMITVDQFRKDAKQLKVLKGSRPNSTEEQLREENAKLKRENAELKKTNEELKQQLLNKDVFNFDAHESSEVTRQPATQRVMAEIHIEPAHKRARQMANEFQDLIEQMREDDQEQVIREPADTAEEVNEVDVTYTKGEEVLAYWEPDDEWCDAKIVRVNKVKGYFIRYFDNYTQTVTKNLLRKK